MVWQPPEELERRQQARWRATIVWGAFGLLLLVASGAQRWIPKASEVPLAPAVTAGRLWVQVPQGWRVTTGREQSVHAVTGSASRGQKLHVKLVETLPNTSPLEVLQDEYETVDLGEGDRWVRIGDRRAVLVSLGGTAPGEEGTEVEAHVTVLAFEAAPETIATISLESLGEWTGTDEIVIQQVARTLRVVEVEPARRLEDQP